MIPSANPTTTKAWQELASLAKNARDFDFRSCLDAERVRACQVPMAGGLSYDYAALPLDEAVLDTFQELANELKLLARYRELLDGEFVNTGENRRVLHHLTRGQLGNDIIERGRNLGEFYSGELLRIRAFAQAVHAGEKRGGTGKTFTTVVQIGIGGSDLGPRALYIALENWAAARSLSRMKACFISNVDPDDGAQVLSTVDLERTLFILVSKSGTTQETLANELFVKEALKKAGLDAARHMVAVTSESSPLANNAAYLDSFYIDDYIGGRYSSTSAVGAVVLSLAFGSESFRSLLEGAHEADRLAMENELYKNAALMDACAGVWLRNFLGFPMTAILPYSQALARFPAHLQQLDMESNGKRVDRQGKPLAYASGPIVFGEPGTNGQHSFYQLLHQGTDVVPLQFIGFRSSQQGKDIVVDGSTSMTKLKANLAAQIVAFAKGKDDENANKVFPGHRPSSLIVGESLTPNALGALLAHYENKVMFQGFIWNVNSFDQEGVQLGKLLTKQVLSGNAGDTALEAYAQLLGID